MRILVQKIPGIVFVFAALWPVIGLVLESNGFLSIEIRYFKYVLPMSSSVVYLWFLSMNDYFNREIQWQKKDYVSYVTIFVFGVKLYGFYDESTQLYLMLPSLCAYIYIVVKMVEKISVLFEKRSLWFLVFELLLPWFGMTTLTAEVQRWEKTKGNEF